MLFCCSIYNAFYLLQHVIGENCTVHDPLYQVPFDLRGLTKAGDDDYIVYDDESRRNFTLNVCGALRSHRNDSCAINAGACVGQGDSAINLGEWVCRLRCSILQLNTVVASMDLINITCMHYLHTLPAYIKHYLHNSWSRCLVFSQFPSMLQLFNLDQIQFSYA